MSNIKPTDELKYKARVYVDKAILPQIEEDLRVMVYTLIGDKKLEITHDRKGFDVYPSCKDSLKEWCPGRKKKYQARLPEHALVWFGDNRIDLYCQIIASIAGRKVYMPFSDIPRQSSKELEDCEEESTCSKDIQDSVVTPSERSLESEVVHKFAIESEPREAIYTVATKIDADIGTTESYTDIKDISATSAGEAINIHQRMYNSSNGYYASVILKSEPIF